MSVISVVAVQVRLAALSVQSNSPMMSMPNRPAQGVPRNWMSFGTPIMGLPGLPVIMGFNAKVRSASVRLGAMP